MRARKYFVLWLFVITLAIALYPANLSAAIFYEVNIPTHLGRNITYISNFQITDRGFLDVHVLRVPLNNPHVQLGPVQSRRESQLREPTTTLLNAHGAVAGINGDFFNMAGTHSAVTGPVIQNGRILAIDGLPNMHYNRYAAFMLDNANNPFIEYLRTEIHFINNGQENFRIFAINKITDMSYATAITHDFMQDTGWIDARFPYLYKIVVDNGFVTHISYAGQWVGVPENGFVVLFGAESAEFFTSVVNVGETASLNVVSTVDLNLISQAIGGGGKLLIGGQAAPQDSGFVVPGRHPRTAVGFTRDRSEAILMVVDGRSHSIGASHYEMAALMQQFGAYEAMHLDGGGSSTMGVRRPGQDYVTAINRPSDGSQRRVSNALGVFIHDNVPGMPVGDMRSLEVRPQATRTFMGTGLPVNIFGMDEFQNELSLNPQHLSVGVHESAGWLDRGFFFPLRTGTFPITATYHGMAANANVDVHELAVLLPNRTYITSSVGDRTLLEFNGLSTDGFSAYIYTGVQFEVVPAYLGHVEGSTFVAGNLGTGYIRAFVGGVQAFIDVHVGYRTLSISSFEDGRTIWFSGYPEGVRGHASYSTERVRNGSHSIRMDYQLIESDSAQVANVVFETAIVFPQNTIRMHMQVYGNNSYHWLRARLRDAQGGIHIVDLTQRVNWTGWRQVEVDLPQAPQPFMLERIYVASLANIDTYSHTLFFDNLTGVVLHGAPQAQGRPPATVFVDRLQANLQYPPPPEAFDITLAGNLAFFGDENNVPVFYRETQTVVLDALQRNSSRVLLGGVSDLENPPAIPHFQWNRHYNFFYHGNVGIVHLSAANGGLHATNPEQWASLFSDISYSGRRHIIVVIDQNPADFRVSSEVILFQDAMETLSAMGKNIFVVYTGGNTFEAHVRNGVRYIGIGDLWAADGTTTDNFSILRFRVFGDDIYYSLINVL